MTKEQAKELLPIIQAWIDGKTIQYDEWNTNKWEDLIGEPNFHLCKWRIKPEPREFWVKEYPNSGFSFFTCKLTSQPSDDYKIIHLREVLP